MFQCTKFLNKIYERTFIVTIIISFLFAPLLLINLIFFLETVAGLKRHSKRLASPSVISVVIIIPAHDEAAVIGRTLDRLKTVIASNFTLLVVADNSEDETAAIARRLSVRVIERHDLEHRGKGHALAFARDWLLSDPPAAVIVLDADCHSDGYSLNALAEACQRTNKPCQAINLLEPCPSAVPMVQISTFAFLLKNLVRQRGLQRLTGGVHLTGTGMCLPWQHFERADLATSSIVEDVRLGLELAKSGAQPQLVEEAMVWSAPSDAAGTLTQRRRWEGGLLTMAQTTAPQAILRGLKTFDLSALLSGLDLLVPPLAMLAFFNATALIVAAILAAFGWSGWAPSMMLALVGSASALAILAAWWREGRQFLTSRTLLRLPFYVLWKVPMYFNLARRGAPSEWLRTGRPTKTDQEG